MKISRVLLRWYKSFNINYYGYDDRRHGVRERAWNGLGLDGDTESYRFVEIPIHSSVTTIVGANESGKSHLLSAISKVIRGVGIPDDRGEARFDVTDLCHYASVKDKNAEVWPNIGLEFDCQPSELQAILQAAGQPTSSTSGKRFTLVLAPRDDKAAWIFLSGQELPIGITNDQLDSIRKHLVPVEFIHSEIPLPDEVIVDDILAQLNSSEKGGKDWFTFQSAQAAAALLADLTLEANKPVSPEVLSLISQAKGDLAKRRLRPSRSDLEAKLFSDVLGIKKATFERLATLGKDHRGYVEGLISVWNDELDRTLNLSHYWQQDDQFALRVDFKDGVFYFEITDKTGSIYTFRERSSGLRYFLSYYIQAKSLERKYRDSGCVILMDEPDCFLSIAAQKNLLSVFESLVSAGSATDRLQIVYTTHSPFLVNQNYPNRIRLVRKGDAEEGTQFIDESRLRHYEPVRSALGIDCAQTLFMGETNVVLEGPCDQFLLAELNRIFVMNRDPAAFLDLTSIVLMSAESASGIAKLLDASKWGDERVPATVVLYDGDKEGLQQRDRVTGKSGKKGESQLIAPQFVLTIVDALGQESDGQAIVTLEDLIPSTIYVRAVDRYLQKWYPDVLAQKEKAEAIKARLDSPSYAKSGLVAATGALFRELVHPERETYDKMGVLQEVVSLVNAEVRPNGLESAPSPEISKLEGRLKRLCEELWRRIDVSRQASRRDSVAKAVRREVDDFFKRFKTGAPAFDVVRVLGRLGREVHDIGEDGSRLRSAISQLEHEIGQFRSRGESMVSDKYWERWSKALWRVRENPLQPDIPSFTELEIDKSTLVAASVDGPDKSVVDKIESGSTGQVEPTIPNVQSVGESAM